MKFKDGWHAPGLFGEIEKKFACWPSGEGKMLYSHGPVCAVYKQEGKAACARCAHKLGIIYSKKRSHRNSPRKTARERAVYVINRGAMAEDIEKQIQLAVKAYAKRKANRK